MTHLNPAANNLDLMTSDILRLRDKRSISKRHYDHATGKLSRLERIRSRDMVIVSGLHAYMTEQASRLFDLRIYMEMDEELRRYFKLRRDVVERNKSAARTLDDIERSMQADFLRFVRPQRDRADLILTLLPHGTPDIETEPEALRFSLAIELPHGSREDVLADALAGLCRCQVLPAEAEKDDRTAMLISGNPSPEMIALAAKKVRLRWKPCLISNRNGTAACPASCRWRFWL